jgi:hypothetical protein
LRYSLFSQITLILLLQIAVLPLSAVQTSDSLKARARANGGKASSMVNLDLPFASLEDVVSAARLIVRARIQSTDTKLTKNENFVMTCHTFTAQKILKDAVGIAPTRRTPQQTIPLVFCELGGVIKVEGLEIRQTVNTSVSPSLAIGEDVLLLLDWDSDAEAFILQNGPDGLLRIRREIVSEDSRRRTRKLTGKTVGEIEAEIAHLVKGSGRTPN